MKHHCSTLIIRSVQQSILKLTVAQEVPFMDLENKFSCSNESATVLSPMPYHSIVHVNYFQNIFQLYALPSRMRDQSSKYETQNVFSIIYSNV
jgi:hypothetical protein